ncbi:MAG: hypothetical protein ACM3NQ_01845 [Bacteroidales bacterium]
MARTTSFIFILLLTFAATAAAQADSRSYWGVTGSFVPTWKVQSNVTYLYGDADALNISGGEFTVGVARGKTYGGDWGVTYLHRTFKQGSYIDQGVGTTCVNNDCIELGTRYMLDTVTLNGIEGHKFVNFVTIKKRAQIGMIFGGGVAWESGVMEGTYTRMSGWTPNGGIVVEQGTEQAKYTDVFLSGTLSVVPLGQVEVAANVILAPGLKVRFSGGLNFPGYQVARISAVYLIGAR